MKIENGDEKYPEGHFVSIWIGAGIAIGAGIGVPFGIAIGNPAFLGIGLPIGLSIGVAIGSSIEARYKKEGKCLKQYYRYEERHRVVDGVKQKRCCRCKRWKAESEFYKSRSYKDGLQFWCKACANKATNESRKKRRTTVRK